MSLVVQGGAHFHTSRCSLASPIDVYLLPATATTGQISFLEWLDLRPVHDERSFNCAGLHGLTRRKVKICEDVSCSWCERNVSRGNEVFGCRSCRCHACLDCAATQMRNDCNSNIPRIICKRDHRLTWRHTHGPVPTICNSCEGLTAARAIMFSCRFVISTPRLLSSLK